ncbi:heavy metal translocating P-type ATPase [Azorhizobium sp. AG788]|uniref:heavy metal translocating P-type ATPase n=1 Tax=Azorhizobium sp. AG788 TaxID=2183897 RepID=UPI0031386BD0
MKAPLMQSRFRVTGMDCASCAMKIDAVARRASGVEDISVSVTAGTMTVRHAPTTDLAALRKTIVGLGYEVLPLERPAGAVENPATPHATAHGSCCGGKNHDHAHDHGHIHASGDHGHDHASHGDHDHAPHGHHGAPAPAADLHGHDHGSTGGVWWRSAKARTTALSGIAFVVAFAVDWFFPAMGPWAFTLAMLIGLVPIARRAVMAGVNGMPFTIETLMTIAAVGAVIIGASEEAAAVVFLFLVGEWLEGVAAGRARASIQSLTNLVPKTALLARDGSPREVPAESLAVGDIILVRPGDRLPADGVILAGESAIDEAPVTGESTPVRKGVAALVFAGTVNGDAALRVRVSAAAADNTIARIVKLVEEAQESKAPTERFIDRFSRYYTPAVVVVAALVAVVPPLVFGGPWDEWIYKGLAILLIGCPCALVISTPAAIAAGLSTGARRGLLLKGGAVLEGAGKITAVCFDKTGTLTAGKPEVTDVVAFARSAPEVLALAAALEMGSSHPLAKAILGRAAADGVPVPPASDAMALSGKGVTAQVDGRAVFFGSAKAAHERVALTAEQRTQLEALSDQGKTVSVLIADGIAAGAIAMRDEPRPDALQGLKTLTAAGIKTLMLTGDNRRTAEGVGRQLGIEVRAELLPQDKQRIIGELQAQGFVVAKVGDGINDAPALAAADIGIAMGGGTDVALETADAAILHGRVGDVAAMMDLSKRTMGNIRQNLVIALGLKAVFLVTTVVGITGLWPAILADTGATVLVTLNALRLLRAPGPR